MCAVNSSQLQNASNINAVFRPVVVKCLGIAALFMKLGGRRASPKVMINLTVNYSLISSYCDRLFIVTEFSGLDSCVYP